MDETRRERQRDACKRWRAKNVERERERNREYAKTRVRNHASDYQKIVWDKARWLRIALTHARHRAKKAGMDFDIAASDVEVPDVCPILGIELKINRGRNSRSNHDSPSLDRIDNSKGYVKGNVRVVSSRANSLKSDASIDEMEKILRYMRDARDNPCE